MDINYARFVFEVQRVHERMAEACCSTPARPQQTHRPLPAQRTRRWSVRQATATALRRLAVWVDVPGAQPVSG